MPRGQDKAAVLIPEQEFIESRQGEDRTRAGNAVVEQCRRLGRQPIGRFPEDELNEFGRG